MPLTAAPVPGGVTRELLWLSLPDQRPRRELFWMSKMPDTHVTAMAAQEPVGDMTWIPTSYRRPIIRFIEAGAFAWANGLDDVLSATAFDWTVSLELCSLVTGQLNRRRRQAQRAGRERPLQAVITWENLPRQPLYALPPYKQAFEGARGADLLLCMVDAAAVHLDLNGFDMSKVRVVKPGIDTDIFTVDGPRDEPDRPRVVFTSPLAPNKGIDTVLEAMTLVRRKLPDAQLIVAGGGPLAGLVDDAAGAHPGSVVHAGSLDAHGVARLLRSAHVFTTAPRPTFKWTEQLGLAYLEAQACGLPVVTTACGTNDEAVHPPNWLVANDAAAVAEGLLHFLTNPAERARVGAINARRMLDEHNLTLQTRRMGEAFAEFE